MNREAFLKRLSAHLSKMTKAERDDILRDFEEYFDCAVKDGEDEQTICSRLGDPKKIAKEYFVQKNIENANRERSAKTIMQAFVSSAGLGILNFLYVVFVVVVGYILIAALYIAIFSAGISGIGVFVYSIVCVLKIGAYAFWFFTFTGLGTLFLSVLGVIGINQLVRQFKRANLYFLNKISSGLKRRVKDE